MLKTAFFWFPVLTAALNGQYYLRNNINKVPMHVLVQMAKDIVSGMEHLRANDVVHRDLAARNLLLEIRSNGEHRVKVSELLLQTLERMCFADRASTLARPCR